MVAIGPKAEADPLDARIAALASVQRGVVARRQLVALGASPAEIKWRLGAGRLHPVYRGVYAVGHRSLTRHGHFAAAVLAIGGDAVLSHLSAAHLWRMREDLRSAIELSTTGRSAPRPGLGVHRLRVLPADECTRHDGLPVTTAERTLIDIAPRLTTRRLQRALDEAHHVALLDHDRLAHLLDAHPKRPGAPILKELLASHVPGTTRTRSPFEEDFLGFCGFHGLQRPEINARVGPFTVDALWSDQRLIVELDGWHTHGTRAAFRRDRARDRRLVAAGYRVIRLTWDDLTATTAATLRQLLAG